jgi:hypothetical protein
MERFAELLLPFFDRAPLCASGENRESRKRDLRVPPTLAFRPGDKYYPPPE